jgi:hypothetical protein
VAVAAGCMGTVMSPSLPARCKRRCPQLDKPPGGLEEAGDDQLCAIPRLDGNIFGCTYSASPSPSSPNSILLFAKIYLKKNFKNNENFRENAKKSDSLFIKQNGALTFMPLEKEFFIYYLFL